MSKPTPMSFDEAVRVLRKEKLVVTRNVFGDPVMMSAVDPNNKKFSCKLKSGEDIRALALAIETISQSAEGENS